MGSVTENTRVHGTEAAGDAETTAFWGRVRRRTQRRLHLLLLCAGRFTLAGSVLTLLLWMFSQPVEAPAAPWSADPLSSTTVLALGAGLAAFVSGIWVAAVQQSTTPDAAPRSANLESTLVRLKLFAAAAKALISTTTVLTIGALTWFSGLPDQLDLLRSGIIVAAAAFVILIAADAAVLSENPEGAGFTRYQQLEPAQQLRDVLASLHVHPDTRAREHLRLLTARQVFLPTAITLIVLPAISTALTVPVNPPHDGQLLGRFLLGILSALVSLCFWIWLSYLLAGKRYVEAALGTCIAGLLTLAVIVGVAEATLQAAAPMPARALAGSMLSVTLILVPPLVLHGFGAMPYRAPRAVTPPRTAVVIVITALYLQRLHRQQQRLERYDGPSIDPLAIAAACCLLVPPAALLLAVAARAKLRATPEVPGRGLATFSAWTAAILLAAPLVALIIWWLLATVTGP